ncbi:MAG TPA: AAA family ATPase [Acidimicrobiales bacterium]|nr:AAA family ATPase [Acidimicrobiales bacterium]
MPPLAGDAPGPTGAALEVTLLGQFAVRLGGNVSGPWRRPPAKRLCALVLISPGRRVGREVAMEALFPRLAPRAAARALSQALSYAREALSTLGEPGRSLVEADRALIWANPAVKLEVDLDLVEERLSFALAAEPGDGRDKQLVLALRDGGVLLEDEPFADWASHRKERLERARQQARLELARDRARGLGRSGAADVVDAWETCLECDPTCEEAASALVRVHAAQGRHGLALAAYNRCRGALQEHGLSPSPVLEDTYRLTRTSEPSQRRPVLEPPPAQGEERRLISMLFVEVGTPSTSAPVGLEEFRELVGGSLADVVAQVEALGGTVTAISGAGLAAIFGAPESHEDDPERALRAAFRVVSSAGHQTAGVVARAGVESGQAAVGTLVGALGARYSAVGEVVSVASVLQSAARPGSVLVGPAARSATEDLFYWGPTEEVEVRRGGKALLCSHLERPKPRTSGQAGRRALARGTRLLGRHPEMAVIRDVINGVVAGNGAVLVLSGDPGLGKTRLVSECRRLFMAWVGAASGRLPLWLEGRAASYAASSPFGLYQHVLGAWVGAAPEEPEPVLRAALERALLALFPGETNTNRLRLLTQMMARGPAGGEGEFSSLAPEKAQKAIFEALREVVCRMVANGPTVLVFEDLHWADPTSLRLTERLASIVPEGPLLLLLTRRPEPDPGVTALEEAIAADRRAGLRTLKLAALDTGTERELAKTLLGGGAPDDVVDLVTQGTDGNPLFLEERLSSLLGSRAVVQGEGGWEVDRAAKEELPEALERLIISRVDRMGSPARQVIVAASVVGAEFSLSELRTVSPVKEGLETTLASLCQAGLITRVSTSHEPAYRFRHALIQEAAYRALLKHERLRLHASLAWSLEQSCEDRPQDVAALLGYHFAAAGEAIRAAHYLELAGDQAASVFSTEEAEISYRTALSLIGVTANAEHAAVLLTKLMEILWRAGRWSEAEETFHEAIGLARRQPLLRARLHYILGRIELWRRGFDAAEVTFRAAESLLEGSTEDFDQETFDLWFDLEMEGFGLLHYWRDEPEKVAGVLEKVRPALEGRGGPFQRQAYYNVLALWRVTENRHRVDDEMVANSRSALEVAEHVCGQNEVGWRVFGLGWLLLLHGELAEAEERLAGSLSIGERVGDGGLVALSRCYLTMSALRRHDAAEVAARAPKAVQAAETIALPEYAAMARATLAWLAWEEGRTSEVETLAQEALMSWKGTAWHPFHWICLWPVIAVRLARGRTADAIEASRELLAPTQQLLPDELVSAVEAAIAAWEGAKTALAAKTLRRALDVARRLRYA